MNYRREIDGLRAVAVIPVILFHAGFTLFSGGFVGVDVFFVISGYLITYIILAEREAGEFSIGNFYERRARRILPALFFVMLVSLPFAWFLMLPKDLKSFSDSVAAVSVFASNFLFWSESGYFDTTAALKPLLHTWSLAVEEQYYVFFPLFIIVFWQFGKMFLIATLCLLCLVSFLLAQMGGNMHFSAPYIKEGWSWWNLPSWGFYFTPTRGWELLIGALISFFVKRERTFPSSVSQWSSIVGISLIAYAVFGFDENTPFPSVYTLVPTIGAALIILFASPKTVVGKALGHPWLVGIGLISYSTYLWHQPIFAFARLYNINKPSLWVFTLLALVSFVLAYFTWRYIEQPFRNKSFVNKKCIFASAFVVSALLFSIGCVGSLNDGFDSRYKQEVLAAFSPSKTSEDENCKWARFNESFPEIKVCEFGDVKASHSIALYGDSHAQTLFDELDDSFTANGIRGLRLRNRTCNNAIPWIVKDFESKPINVVEAERCLESHHFLIQELKQKTNGIIVLIRWTTKMYPVSNYVELYGFDNGEGGVEQIHSSGSVSYIDGVFKNDPQAKKSSIENLVKTMLSSNKMIYLIYPIPASGWHIPQYNLKSWQSGGEIPATITTSYERFEARHHFVVETLDSIGEYSNLFRIKPENVLCNTRFPNRCVAQLNGVPLYYDDDHLSNAGARLLVDEIMTHIRYWE